MAKLSMKRAAEYAEKTDYVSIATKLNMNPLTIDECYESQRMILEQLLDDECGDFNPWTGKRHTDEVKQLLSDMNSGVGNPFFGRKHTERTKAILAAVDKRGEKNGMYGKVHNDTTKQKISDKAKGNKRRLGDKHSEETKAKLRMPRGKCWNNGSVTVVAHECPEGFSKGKLMRKKDEL
jgi:hypothetical protein